MRRILDYGLPIVGLLLLIVGSYIGLVLTPAEKNMGDVYRIIYVHVPAAWVALVAFTITFVASLVYLFKSSWKADALAEASTEIGIYFAVLLIVLGSIWAKPTWGVYWTWDPRLTSAAILVFAYAGYMALRRFVDDPERRATWAAVSAIIISVDIPVVWFSVKWWRSIHQVQSGGDAISHPLMKWALGINGFAFLFIFGWLLTMAYRTARRRQLSELTEPPEDEPPAVAAPKSTESEGAES